VDLQREREVLLIKLYSREGYIAPKKAYSFDALIQDILDFAALTLVDEGRLSMWLPTANDEDIEVAVPQHQCFTLVSVCLQEFNKCTCQDDVICIPRKVEY
jgi:tRNA (guanine10-N2)-methyltransferase